MRKQDLVILFRDEFCVAQVIPRLVLIGCPLVFRQHLQIHDNCHNIVALITSLTIHNMSLPQMYRNSKDTGAPLKGKKKGA